MIGTEMILKQIFKQIIIITNLIILTSCLANPSDNKPSTNTPEGQSNESHENANNVSGFDALDCTKPCWISIVPGATNHQEAETILQQQYGLDNLEISMNRIAWTSNDLDHSIGGSLNFFENTVDYLYVAIEADYLHVADFFEKFGRPESIRLARAFSSKYQCAGATLLYPTLGVEVPLIPDNEVVGVKEEQFISSITILSPRLLENEWVVTDSFTVDWNGYQDYCP